ncbi:MAG: sensor histidine kinase [Patulibacter sp.]|nr:sensor histidine kinase [Patulibacter sp.]
MARPAPPIVPTAKPAAGLRRLLPAVLWDDTEVDDRPPPRTARDWAVDVACFLLAIVAGLLAQIDASETRVLDGPWRWVDIAIAVPACLALWVRRRWPVALAVGIAPLTVLSPAAGGAAMIFIFTVAVHRPARTTLVVAGLHVLLTFPYMVLYPDPELPYWVVVGFVLMMISASVAWGMVIRSRRQLVRTLRERAIRAEGEQQLRIEQAQQGERTRIAREMHDVLAHRISLLSMHAGALEFRPDAPPEDVSRAAGVIRASAHQALEDLREVIGVLREDDAAGDGAVVARPQPTLAAVPTLLDESRDAGMRIRARIAVGELDRYPAGPGRTAYRIVQEGLTNARKHAAGTTVTVAVAGRPGEGLTLEVLTPGRIGAAREPQIPGTGTGLVGLAERIELSAGRLDHGPTDDGGFGLRAWLPWPT